MIETVKCPNCNAQVHTKNGNGIIRCEYCDCEIIVNNPTAYTPPPAPYPPRQTPQQFVPPPVITDNVNYAEKKKAWNKSLKTYLIIEAVITFIWCILVETNADVLFFLSFIASVVFSFAMPSKLLKTKPLSESEKVNGNFLNYLKTYLPFAGAFWAGVIIEVILESP